MNNHEDWNENQKFKTEASLKDHYKKKLQFLLIEIKKEKKSVSDKFWCCFISYSHFIPLIITYILTLFSPQNHSILLTLIIAWLIYVSNSVSVRKSML